MSGVIYKRIPRPAARAVELARALPVADLVEAMHALVGQVALVDAGIRPVQQRQHAAGPAITSLNHPGDNCMIYPAIATAQPGDMLMISSQGSVFGPVFGDTTALECRTRGLAGTVADGSVRDLADILDHRYPLWARHVSASHPEKSVPGSVNVPIVIGGVLVYPGDVVAADDDGVIVLPRARALEIATLAHARRESDVAVRARIAAGESIVDIKGFGAALASKGVQEVDGTWLHTST
ncbi:4-carboxy-4-hydroxy-2-oxoadipate aldolase/oxaloacetate decarboxylase [Variovorax sp. LjRoot290]|uniref:4-carboxy-4-hydroxy-2-oxoadipate aldolase/oxaloacetate decarboxylase n=1 Tax=Variovorax sp. LjRoot290 TaxID=3342316 RepID=UPI003ECD718B